MIARIAADLVVLLHVAFVVFVVVGALLVVRYPAVAWAHVPAAVWGAYAELTATICPLTPLENALRTTAGQSGYSGGFVEHYLMPILYPAGLTPLDQRWIGALVITINVIAYAAVLVRRHRRRHAPHRMQGPQRLAPRADLGPVDR